MEKKVNFNFIIKFTEEQEKNVEKLAEDINNILKIISEREKDRKVAKAYVYTIPNEKQNYLDNKEIIEKKTNISVEI